MSLLVLAAFLALAPALSYADDDMSPEDVQKLVIRYADAYGLPHSLVLRTVKRESRFVPSARNGPYWGLMQIRYDTAKGVGYSGPATGLLDPEVNLTYGVAYLANAYMIARGNESRTHRLYRSGYYYEAKRLRLLAKLIKGTPAVAQPQVMLASVLPEPQLPLAYAREPEPVPMPLPLPAPDHDEVAAAPASAEPADDMPLPAPNPKRLAASAPAELPKAAAAPSEDVSSPAFDVASEDAVPLPRPRPTQSAAAARPMVTAMILGMPLPKPRPIQ